MLVERRRRAREAALVAMKASVAEELAPVKVCPCWAYFGAHWPILGLPHPMEWD